MGDITISEIFEDSIYQTRKLLSGLKRNLREYPYIVRVIAIVVFIGCAFILIMSKPFHESALDELKARHQNDMYFRSNKL